MPWHAVSPVGNRSVRFNRADMNDNTTYIGNTLGNATNTLQDHYWDIGANEDGRHRQVTMRSFGENIQAPLAPLMDAAIYLNRETDNELQVRAREATADWRLNLWETLNKGTFTTPGDNSVFSILPMIPNRFGFVLIYLKVTPFLAMDGYFYSDNSGKVHGFSGSIDFNTSNFVSRPPIAFATDPSTLGFLRASIPSSTGYNSYKSKTYQYLVFHRAAF